MFSPLNDLYFMSCRMYFSIFVRFRPNKQHDVAAFSRKVECRKYPSAANLFEWDMLLCFYI